MVHNTYQHRGGEDAAVEAEVELLRSKGHEVHVYERDNFEIEEMGKSALLAQTLWSKRTHRDFINLKDSFRPDIIHAHNTFPLVSPSLYWAASQVRVPIVQTLHNFRLHCAQAMYLRDGKVCEDCLGKLPWRGVVRKCYRNSMSQSAVLVGMLALHRTLGTYREKVTRYVALNEFCKKKFVQGGLPPEKIVIKPNFVDLPRPAANFRRGGLFVGRLSPEKGVDTLLGAIELLPNLTLDVSGTGPEQTKLMAHRRIQALGWQEQSAVYQRMCQASYLVMPSLWYENFPRTLVEAFACALPVIASRLGAMAELIEDGKTGLLCEPGSASALAEKLAWAESNPEEMRRMGENARTEYEAKYTSEKNYHQLMAIYSEAIAAAQSVK
ncbi:MAG TPA: glycosyltransferase family 4 protein [Pyrinomonadaceae bacterium]|nr:glycosyltransferase family 4 protein [Pyrinomonadaceae bacterium]